MPRNTQFMNQADSSVIIDGFLLTDFLDGDSIRVIPAGEGSAMDVGLDKATTLFGTNKSGTLEVDLKPTSPALDFINGLFSNQLNGAGRLLSGEVLTSASETYGLSGVSIVNPGTGSTGARTISGRTVVFNVEEIDWPQ